MLVLLELSLLPLAAGDGFSCSAAGSAAMTVLSFSVYSDVSSAQTVCS